MDGLQGLFLVDGLDEEEQIDGVVYLVSGIQ